MLAESVNDVATVQQNAMRNLDEAVAGPACGRARSCATCSRT